ncbi:MAG: PASTA domain-containing protein [Clostridiales bacterium]|nr:PASTA domain-containing protein [Clostridiales bacterium]
MEGNNNFLENYKKKLDLKFEQKTDFVKPDNTDRDIITPKSPSNRRKIWISIVSGAVVLVAILIGLILFFNRGVEVIDLTGWIENDARLWANENGLKLQIEQEYNDDFDAGRIISQSVPKGTKVKKGEFIKVVVSLGHDLSVTLPLPDFMSMTREEIETWAEENYMARVRITAEYSDEVPVGRVIRFEINDETVIDEVNRNTPIYIVVSKGPEDESVLEVVVPNFKEMAIGESYIFANENGLVLQIEEEYDDFVPEGAIISQSIKAEEKVKKGTEITLVVSKGKMITVPDFAGYSKERATAVAGELGIPVTIKERYSTAPPNTFISQSIKAGTEYKKGDILELTYSIDNKIVLPSFVGQTRDAIELWAKELNDQGAGISIKVTNTKSNSPKGTILHQDKANTVIGIKDTIKVTVSQGKVVYVPDFVAPAGSGYDIAITRDKALAMCEELNIVPIFQEANKSGRLPGEIWHQSIEAGKEITEGSTIVLKYVPANVKVTVPNFVGMTKEEILKGKHNKNLDIRFVEGVEYVEGYEGKVYEQSLSANTKTAAGSIITLTIGPNQFIDEIEGIEDIENIEDIEETQKEEVSEEGKDVNQDSKK